MFTLLLLLLIYHTPNIIRETLTFEVYSVILTVGTVYAYLLLIALLFVIDKCRLSQNN